MLKIWLMAVLVCLMMGCGPDPRPPIEPAPAPVAKAAPVAKPALRSAFDSPWAGFRGIPWGTNIADCPDMVLLSAEDDRIKVYRRNGDSLTIGDAKLKTIVYGFYNERFYCFTVFVKGLSNWIALSGAVFARYGQGEKANEFVDDWTWRTEDVVVSLKYDQFSERAELFMLYVPIWHEYDADQKERAKKAATDF